MKKSCRKNDIENDKYLKGYHKAILIHKECTLCDNFNCYSNTWFRQFYHLAVIRGNSINRSDILIRMTAKYLNTKRKLTTNGNISEIEKYDEVVNLVKGG